MKWGVPYTGFLVNGLVTTLVVMFIIGTPPGALIGVGIHLAMRELCRNNPHFFHKWHLWYKTRSRAMTIHLWGGSRLQPSKLRTRKAEDMRVCL